MTIKQSKTKQSSILLDLVDEFKTIVLKQNKILDLVYPVLVFWLAINWLDFSMALVLILTLSLFLMLIRLKNKESMIFIIFGLLTTFLSFVLSLKLGKLKGLFIPDMIIDLGLAIASIISIWLKKPLSAFSSYFVRRWPLNWYWHEKIRPAYSQVTLIWTVFFLLRFSVQLIFYLRSTTANIFLFNLISGWPGTIILLVISYIYGIWYLNKLKGPSVAEFKANKQAPWKGQRKGF